MRHRFAVKRQFNQDVDVTVQADIWERNNLGSVGSLNQWCQEFQVTARKFLAWYLLLNYHSEPDWKLVVYFEPPLPGRLLFR
jgi:hypothetical protein